MISNKMSLCQKAAPLLLLARLTAAYSAAATYFQPGLGACGGTNSEGDMIIALTSNMWEGGGHCGNQLTITYNGVSASATVADQCPTCPGGADIDLSPAVFSALTGGNMGLGRIQVSWEWGSGASEPEPTTTTYAPEPTTDIWSPTTNTWTQQDSITIPTETSEESEPTTTSSSKKSSSSHHHHSSSRHHSSGSSRSGSASASASLGASGFSSAIRPSSTGSGSSTSVQVSGSGNVQDAQKLVLQLANLVTNYVDKKSS